MWILKNSKELLENLKAQSLHSVNSIKSFDFTTLHTTIPHDKLKSKLKEIINQYFFHKNGNRRFQYVVIGYKDTYFGITLMRHKDAYVIKMLEYLIDNIFVEFGGRIFQQTIGIPMGTNCAPLLANLFLYSYEAEFVQSLFQAGKKHPAQKEFVQSLFQAGKKHPAQKEFVQSLFQAGKKHPAQKFNFTYRYRDDVLSLKNTKFCRVFRIHLSTWTWNKGNNGDCSLLLILGLLSLYWQWKACY